MGLEHPDTSETVLPAPSLPSIPQTPDCKASFTLRALEILRIALMQGELDDIRNDMARALLRDDIAPDALDSLLQGILALGVPLRKTQGVVATMAEEMRGSSAAT
ncbi:hypothetical protein EIP91_004148 [Steccherinum ochraceum]|uniref:Uncharacterized protein n=1 Tax=Steccherinum ochraceum TaxID=92696 RepID=A0A4V2MXH7_9APHY|nr:hypothetical protein EIP91_004148 [Steccherinum ochraceum]